MRTPLLPLVGALLGFLVATPALAVDKLDPLWRWPLTAGHLPPVAVDGAVLLAEADGTLIAIDAAAGTELSREVGRRLVALYGGVSGLGIDADGAMFTIDAAAKRIRMEACLPAASAGTGDRSGAMVVQPLADGSVIAIDVGAGREVWRTPFEATLRVAVDGDLVFAMLPRESLWILAAATGSPLTGLPLPRIDSLPAMAGDTLIVGLPGQRLIGLDPRGGRRRFSTELGRGPTTDLLGVGETAIVATQANQLVAVRSNGTPRWRAPLPGRVLSPLRRWQDLVIAIPYRRRELLGFDLASGALQVTAGVGDGMEWLEGEAHALPDVLLVVVRKGAGRELVAFGRRSKLALPVAPAPGK